MKITWKLLKNIARQTRPGTITKKCAFSSVVHLENSAANHRPRQRPFTELLSKYLFAYKQGYLYSMHDHVHEYAMTGGEAAVFDEWQKAMLIWSKDRRSQPKSTTLRPPPTTVKSGVKHVLVEGNIGCGKTHMIRWFERVHGDSVQSLCEPVAMWRDVRGHNLLDAAYLNPRLNCFALQMYALLTMFDVHMRKDDSTSKRTKLMERSTHSVIKVFSKAQLQSYITREQMKVLADYFDTFQWQHRHHTNVSMIVYLRSNPADCLQRVQKRARAEEKNTVSLEYLEHLHKMHEEWLNPSDGVDHVVLRSGESCPVITINVDPNSHALEKEYERLANTLTSL